MRIQLIEFNDFAYSPAFVRESITETLGTGLRWLDMGAVAGPSFVDFCRKGRVRTALDLCSGTGDSIALLLDWTAAHATDFETPRFVLSDLFLNEGALVRAEGGHAPHLRIERAAVDATRVPERIEHDARTLFNAFHHFRPPVARRILADAVQAGRSIFIYEGFPRSLARFGATAPHMLLALLANPLRAPRRRVPKAIFTYLVPIIPLLATWDAIISTYRMHSEDELRAMVAPFGERYSWEYCEIPYALGGRAVVFHGIPADRLARSA